MHIQTVLGSIEPSLIGHAQCHEHILLAKGKSYEINPALCIDDVEKSLVELKRYGAKGGSLIVDAQPGGCGRMSNELAGISEEAKVYIVASTGFHKLMFYPEGHWIHNITTDGLALYMVTELTEGMYINGDDNYPAHISNHKAGMIKMALDKEGLSERYKRIFDAGIKASINTGAPIQCHTENAEQGPIIAAYLLEARVLPHNNIICHL